MQENRKKRNPAGTFFGKAFAKIGGSLRTKKGRKIALGLMLLAALATASGVAVLSNMNQAETTTYTVKYKGMVRDSVKYYCSAALHDGTPRALGGGLMYNKETSSPTGFVSSGTKWYWYVKVVDASSWSSLSVNCVLGGSTSGTFVIGKNKASSDTAWHYVKASDNSSYTADYADYATYADTSSSKYNAATSLANSGVTAGLSLSKVDASTGGKRTGAVFTIYEYIGSKWYEVGTLTDKDKDGVYTDITIITMHDAYIIGKNALRRRCRYFFVFLILNSQNLIPQHWSVWNSTRATECTEWAED